MSDIEYEVTYLARIIPEDLLSSNSKVLMDMYFPASEPHPRLRLRQKGETYEMTKKEIINAGDASTQTETTINLSKEEFEGLSKGEGKQLKKRRYFYDYKGRTAEVDVFEDALKGLVVVEFEFSNKEEKNNFKIPDFCLVDVTQENFIAGGMLAGKNYEDLTVELDKFNYKRL